MRDPVIDRLKTRREELGLSQSDVGKRCGMSRSVVSRIENGESSPVFRTLRRIVRALDLEIELVDIALSPIEQDIEYLRSLSADQLERELLSRRWFVQPNDMVGGYCAMPVNAPPSSGCFPIAEFMSEKAATLIVEMHNSTIK